MCTDCVGECWYRPAGRRAQWGFGDDVAQLKRRPAGFLDSMLVFTLPFELSLFFSSSPLLCQSRYSHPCWYAPARKETCRIFSRVERGLHLDTTTRKSTSERPLRYAAAPSTMTEDFCFFFRFFFGIRLIESFWFCSLFNIVYLRYLFILNLFEDLRIEFISFCLLQQPAEKKIV